MSTIADKFDTSVLTEDEAAQVTEFLDSQSEVLEHVASLSDEDARDILHAIETIVGTPAPDLGEVSAQEALQFVALMAPELLAQATVLVLMGDALVSALGGL